MNINWQLSMYALNFTVRETKRCGNYHWYYKLEICSKKEYCKQCRHDKFKGTMTKWPVQKQTHRTTQQHVEHPGKADI